jgi:hypothetical protein
MQLGLVDVRVLREIVELEEKLGSVVGLKDGKFGVIILVLVWLFFFLIIKEIHF